MRGRGKRPGAIQEGHAQSLLQKINQMREEENAEVIVKEPPNYNYEKYRTISKDFKTDDWYNIPHCV